MAENEKEIKERAPSILPDQAISNLMQGMSDIEPDIKRLTQTLIFQIPAHKDGISLLCQYLIDMGIYPSGITYDRLLEIKQYWHTSKSITAIHHKDKIGSKFPVFFGINKFYKMWRKEKIDTLKQSYVKGCKLFISTCTIDHDNECKEDHYYRHTYKLRDVLLDTCQSLTQSNKDSVETYRQRTIEFINKSKVANEDWELATSLLNRTRLFGSYLREIDKRQEPIHQEFERRIDGEEAPDSTPFSANDCADPYDSQEHEKTYQRDAGKNGSRLTKKDDQRSLYYRSQALGARNNASITDPHRLTLIGIAQFLDFLFHQGSLIELAYAFILATTGSSESSLASMISTSKNMQFKEGLVYYRSDQGVLFIALNNGKTNYPDHAGKHSGQFMEVLLPVQINSIICSSSDLHPFKEAAENLEMQANHFGIHSPGLNPTARRIKNSFNTLFAIVAFKGQFEASFLGGRIPAQYRAQACYYRFDIHDLNLKYVAGVENFIDRAIQYGGASPELNKFIISCKYFDHSFLPVGYIGSNLYSERDEYLNFLKFMRLKFKHSKDQLHYLSPQKHVDCMISLIETQHLYLYLLIQFLIALRPPGAATNFTTSDHLQAAYSNTKASADWTEMNLAPVHLIIQKQIEQIQSDLQQFKKWALRHNISDNKFDQGLQSLPLAVNYKEKTNTLIFQRLTGSKARTLINHHIKENDLPLRLPLRANNIFRHINATLLYEDVPEIVLDEYMGHGREGLDMFNPWSTTSFTCYNLLENAVDKLAEKITKTPLKINFDV